MASKSATDEAKALNAASQDKALPAVSDMGNALEQHVLPRSLIGKGVTIEGDIAAKEDMLVTGKVIGSIGLKANRLEVGEGGRIQANTVARVIIVSGEIIGNVYASDQVIVTKTGSVVGDIFTADVCIEDGAHIKGNIDMQNQEIFKDQHIEMQHDSEEKASGFGFLFKKGRDIHHGDAHDHHADHAHAHGSEEVIPLSVTNKNVSDSKHAEQSVIGESVVIKGKISSEEEVLIQGQVEGIVYFKSHCVGLGPRAQMHGNIVANSVMVQGIVKGDIYAGDKIQIGSHGQVIGKLYAPRVSSEKGSIIKGGINMGPRNVEEDFAQLTGHPAADATQRANEQPVKPQDSVNAASRIVGDFAENRAAGKDSAWPIFYPRN